jgi:hypothetical protein
MIQATKILLIFILVGCLFDVPYGYFQFVRISGCLGFLYLAWIELENERIITGIPCIVSGILLNPIFKIHFTRNIWNKIDLAMAGFLFIWLLFNENIPRNR